LGAGFVIKRLFVSAERAVRQVFDTGVREDIDLKIEIASSPYVTQEIFNKYIDEDVIPAIILNQDLCRVQR
jgi:hypothetical protein